MHTPLSEWYVDTPRNPLQYWGLDYPPLSAYQSWAYGKARARDEAPMRAARSARARPHSLGSGSRHLPRSDRTFGGGRLDSDRSPQTPCAPRPLPARSGALRRGHSAADDSRAAPLRPCAQVFQMVEPEMVALGSSRGHESPSSKRLMRLSVVASDLLFFVPACVAFVRTFYARSPGADRAWALAVLLLQPGPLLVDHGHFQYNGISLGLALGAATAVLAGRDLLGSALYVCSLNHKQVGRWGAPNWLRSSGVALRARCHPACSLLSVSKRAFSPRPCRCPSFTPPHSSPTSSARPCACAIPRRTPPPPRPRSPEPPSGASSAWAPQSRSRSPSAGRPSSRRSRAPPPSRGASRPSSGASSKTTWPTPGALRGTDMTPKRTRAAPSSSVLVACAVLDTPPRCLLRRCATHIVVKWKSLFSAPALAKAVRNRCQRPHRHAPYPSFLVTTGRVCPSETPASAQAAVATLAAAAPSMLHQILRPSRRAPTPSFVLFSASPVPCSCR